MHHYIILKFKILLGKLDVIIKVSNHTIAVPFYADTIFGTERMTQITVRLCFRGYGLDVIVEIHATS